ncbi:MAG: CopG family transcriptional regulator [Chloroflexota bacterium]|nr:CopG family transcriptional regulator [Chloroflexota bacterium]
MKKTMIYLPEETHEGLKGLAFEAGVSIAELIRRAIDIVYGEDIGDIQDMEQELSRYRTHLGSGQGLEEYLSQRKARVSA